MNTTTLTTHSSVEKSGTGVERQGYGVERSGTGIRGARRREGFLGYLSILCLLLFLSSNVLAGDVTISACAPVIGSGVGSPCPETESNDQDIVFVEASVDGVLASGVGRIASGYGLVPLLEQDSGGASLMVIGSGVGTQATGDNGIFWGFAEVSYDGKHLDVVVYRFEEDGSYVEIGTN